MSDRRKKSKSKFRGYSKNEEKNKTKEKKKEKEKEKETREKERSRDKEIKEKIEEIIEIKSTIDIKEEPKGRQRGKEKEKEKILNNIELTSNNNLNNPNESSKYPTIKLNKEKLIELLKCPLCKGFYRTPYTINECMHTFCRSCIFKYFGSSVQRETCPICQTKIGGRPMDSLIFDNYLDSLINILFPKFEELDKENIKLLYKKFRNMGKPLQGDEEEAKIKMPSVKIFIMPENSKENKFNGAFLVQKNFDVKHLKLLIKNRMDKKDIENENICIKYKDKELNDALIMEVIDRQFGFDQDKNVFYYSFKKKGKE
jgi:hypothetical protein